MTRSILRFIPESSAAVPIDWGKIPEKSKEYFQRMYPYVYRDDLEDLEERTSLPQTISDLAESFHESKFFGYMDSELCQFLLDISEFGLKEEKSNMHGLPVGPRFYMKFGGELWFLLFSPGDKAGASGYSAKLSYDYDEETEDSEDVIEAEKDKELAEIFDKKLVDEVSRIGTLNALVSKRLAGWEAFTLESSLEEAQLTSAMMSLPANHPHRVGYMRNFWASLSSRR